MRYEIIDSHLHMSKKRRLQIAAFLREVKNLTEEQVEIQVDFGHLFEKIYGVKWFEAVAFDGTAVVGYMRCYRNPDTPTQWLVGDIHVGTEYRERGIASHLYELIFETLREYAAAEEVIASVAATNIKSIGLHEKMGFVHTGKRQEFANFVFAEDETIYRAKLYQRYPVTDRSWALDRLSLLWKQYQESRKKDVQSDCTVTELDQLLKLVLEDGLYDMESIWCGVKLVGFCYWNDTVEVEYICPESQ